MPNPFFPYMPESTSQVGLGPDPADVYGGDSMEDFYEYLLTPRHHKRWSGSGAIKHFGPDRFASISPEDAAMAEILLGQMEAKAQHEFQGEVRESELGRRQAADRLMEGRTRQPGAGGEITWGAQPGGGIGQAPTRFGAGGRGRAGSGVTEIPAEGPSSTGELTPEQRMTLAAGGYADPTEAARIQAQGMADYRRGQAQGGGPSRTDMQAMEKARNAVDAAAFAVQEAINFEGLKGETPESLLEKFKQNPNSVPELMRQDVHSLFLAERAFENVFGGGGGGAVDLRDVKVR